jgi:Predicted transcriptional regulator, contains C-terminal CBS domains
MTHRLLTVAADDTMLMAWELMRCGKYHHLPVVTDDGHLLGVLDTDLIAAHWRQGGPDNNREPVSSLLADRKHLSVGPDLSLTDAAQIMTRGHTDVLAVTDPQNRLLGLLTTRDLITALAGTERFEQEESANTPSLYRLQPVMPPADTSLHSSLPPD